ncbi:diguanylate cyclase domain-containing protein [Acidithiobacillus caldus]
MVRTKPLSSELPSTSLAEDSSRFFEDLLELHGAWQDFWQTWLADDPTLTATRQSERRLLAALHDPETRLPPEQKTLWHELQHECHHLLHRLAGADPSSFCRLPNAKGTLRQVSAFGKTVSDQVIVHSQYLAERDALTGLPNRRQFERDLLREQALVDRGQDCFVAMIDVDGFKFLNDRHGHLLGDQLLTRVAQRLRESLRRYDGLYRFGGDEFIALLPKLHPQCAVGMADRLCRAIECLHENNRSGLSITVSVGLAPLQKGGDPQAILKTADQALYQAKERGRNRAVVSYPTG